MGFFVRDLHNHITKLHKEQYVGQEHTKSFTVYRGQGLLKADFDQMLKTQGGLLSFNNFLSTSMHHQVSLNFARETMESSNLVGMLFAMKIDPSIVSTPFADIRGVSYFEGEEEILFSMHSIFRIGTMKQIDGNNRLWQVDLTLTSGNDPELHALTEQMRKETYPQKKGWDRLGMLLIKLGQFNKAQEVYDVLLDQATIDTEKSSIYNQLGWVKDGQGEYADAIAYYKQSIEIKQKTLPSNHPDLATSYNNIGLVYSKMNNYSNALSYHQKALEIDQKTLPSNHPDLATSYNNIGTVYSKMNDYSSALSYHQKALEIRQKALPSNHPDLANSYNNIGTVYSKMNDYSSALSYHQKALEIRQKTLPSNHPNLANSYNSIGLVYDNMGDYSRALSFYERSVEIGQRSLQADHPHLQLWKKNLESLKKNM
ncbi:unnamed protein product [Rotaria sordida]|uniref:Kinesin light chain n=1 Tax=Rotaria sordida TaxID=392033 RepID=A0A814EAM3_9BILA|nr:unnamed protein product [Rotaria sordida]